MAEEMKDLLQNNAPENAEAVTESAAEGTENAERRQVLTNEAFKKPLHYIFTKEGIYVSQGDQVEMQHWENMHQAVATGKSIIIYTSKVNASIFPRADLAENTVTVIELICRYMDPKKVKIRQ